MYVLLNGAPDPTIHFGVRKVCSLRPFERRCDVAPDGQEGFPISAGQSIGTSLGQLMTFELGQVLLVPTLDIAYGDVACSDPNSWRCPA